MTTILLPENPDHRSRVLLEWFEAQALELDIKYKNVKNRRVEGWARILDAQKNEVGRVPVNFSRAELRGTQWLGEVLHRAYKYVIDGEGMHR